MKVKITPMQALEYLDAAAKTSQGTRDDHTILGVSVQILGAVIRDNEDLRAKLEALANAGSKLTSIETGAGEGEGETRPDAGQGSGEDSPAAPEAPVEGDGQEDSAG